MLNFPAPRSQTDGQQEQYSEITALDTSDLPDTTRKEFKDEADINYIMSRFDPTMARQPVFSEIDYDLDLQTAIHAVDEARTAYENLPQKLKERFTSWEQLLAALNSGRLRINTERPTTEPTTATPPEPAP